MVLIPSLFLPLLMACSSCSEDVEPAAQSDGVAVELPVELMPELGIPVHPDLLLGSVAPAPSDIGDLRPGVAEGDWQVHRIWHSRKGEDWSAKDVQISFARAGSPAAEIDQLRPEDEAMVAVSSQRVERIGPQWAVTAVRPSGAEELKALKPFEVWIAPHGTTFHSPMLGQMVTIEVMGTQSVTVPGGVYDGLHIRRAWAQGRRNTTEDSWWHPERGLLARSVRVDTDGTVESRLTVLSEFGNALEPQVLRQVWSDARAAMGLPE